MLQICLIPADKLQQHIWAMEWVWAHVLCGDGVGVATCVVWPWSGCGRAFSVWGGMGYGLKTVTD